MNCPALCVQSIVVQSTKLCLELVSVTGPQIGTIGIQFALRVVPPVQGPAQRPFHMSLLCFGSCGVKGDSRLFSVSNSWCRRFHTCSAYGFCMFLCPLAAQRG